LWKTPEPSVGVSSWAKWQQSEIIATAEISLNLMSLLPWCCSLQQMLLACETVAIQQRHFSITRTGC
jgi:hypothetical protein